ncbi:MAG TPA: sigma-54 dependent transcriptional regulator [Terriglobales bacterium]|nr:sigma-54 dependent transcriptional regulator [Terriglobales bacterium]
MHDSVHIVVIDDTAASLELLSSALSSSDVRVHTAATPVAGLELVRRIRPQLVITDLVMPGMSGLDVLEQVADFDPLIDVILMTAHYTTETAVTAIRGGAADYLQKPVRLSLLRDRVAALLASANQRRKAYSRETGQETAFEGMVAQSPGMWRLFALIERIAPHYRSVLIEGATGTGKDLVACALHSRSGVAGKFVVLNCSAVVETLFESELFGHVRGAFTGADRDKVGLLELATGGTLFLDEIGDMPLATQAKLLRALQNQEILPVGSLTPRKINVRIVAATHRNLKAEIASGRFREDLYYRLSMVELHVPALKERHEDISPLARGFVQKFSREFSKPIKGLTPRAMLLLERYDWPGNVRELEHVIGRACMLADSTLLDPQDLPEIVRDQSISNGQESTEAALSTLAGQERRLVEEALQSCGGNQSEAARKLGIGRDALRYKMRRFNLTSS